MITIPTLQELYESILSDIENEYGDSVPDFAKVFLRALAKVQAAKLKLYYLAIAFLQKNIFVDTADRESSGGTLERFGRIKLNRDPFPAVAGKYSVYVLGTAGSVISGSTTFKSSANSLNPNKLFIIDNDFALTTTDISFPATDTITLRALEAGTSSKLEAGDLLTATVPIAGVEKTFMVQSEITEPQEEEDIEEYRRKVIDAYQLEPQGGAATDYRLWSYDATGVQQVYPYAKSGAANEINIYVEATTTASTDGKGTPSALLLSAVEAVVEFDPDTTKPLNERGRRPLGVFDIHFLAITPLNVDIEIPSYANYTAAKETAINASISSTVNAVRPFVAAADILEFKNDILDVNKITNAILTAVPGSSFGTVVLTVNGSPVSTYTFENGEIPYYNSLTFT